MGHKHKHRHNRKHAIEEMEAVYSSLEPPINPIGDGLRDANGNRVSKTDAAWKFYESVREKLPEWWESFNGDLDKYGRLKFGTIREFIKSKTNKAPEIRYLYGMIGPLQSTTTSIPWLGDWEKRRRNGYGLLDSPEKIKPLIKVIKENLSAAESIKATAPFLLEELAQYSNLERQVHEAYAGKAFIRGKEANDKCNIQRFNNYRDMLAACTAMKVKVIREIMRVYGVDPDAPHQMRDMVQMAGGIGAAAALTGIAAGQQIPGLGQSVQTPGGTVIAPYTFDSLKLAEHLTKHAHTFNKPLKVIEADPSSFDDEKPNGKHKGNGKVV